MISDTSQIPVPKEEENILNYLIEVRVKLSQLKQNRAQYLNSKVIQRIYQKVLSEARKLDDIRKHTHVEQGNDDTLIHNDNLHNRVDSILDDVFQLLSLCFLTVGLKNTAPATYASLSTVQSLLEHLDESNVFTHHDLAPIKERLEEISSIVEESSFQEENIELLAAGEEDEDPELIKIDNERRDNRKEQDLLLRTKLKLCLDAYHQIEAKLEEIDPELNSIMEKLFEIRRGLLSLAASTKKTSENIVASVVDKNIVNADYINHSLNKLKEELSEIENSRDENGKFKSLETGKVREKGQNVLNGLLDDCHNLVSDLSHQTDTGLSLDAKLQPIYDRLIDIKCTLENLIITRRWTLRETDLFTYQKQLAEIDKLRVNGKFPTQSNDSKGQSVLLYLLRRCYAIIYKLLESSEPVSESLQPVHNQLATVNRCLLELKRMGGVNNERELYPFQMKLASLDNLRSDGKFYDADGNIPEGQGILNALLAGCFDILHELKVEAEQNSSLRNDGDQDDDEEADYDDAD